MSQPSEQLMVWAALGSRISGFHHDSASKLQSLMMALDEASELIGDDRPDVKHSLDTAMTALRDLNTLLTENRALAKAPQRKAVAVADLLKRAGSRHGVKLTGELPAAVRAHVAPPSIVHALGLLVDLLGGPAKGARTIEVTLAASDAKVTIDLVGTLPEGSASDVIAVAAFLLEREDGAVLSAPRGFRVQLPVAASP